MTISNSRICGFIFAKKGGAIVMCGIAGWIDWEVNLTKQRPILAAMRDTLAPRGPDGEGMWQSVSAAFVHRILSVMDPANGAQPMIRSKGKNNYILTYNGELYNMPELRCELASRGYTFKTSCDTEVLLIAFIEWGPSCVERFNGIFAFGIWDETEQSLFLARDRVGVKPLFYAERDSAFLFGSELKTLLAHPSVQPEIDAEGLGEIFCMGPSRTPGHGVFRDILELKPGHSLIHNRNGTRVYQYWSLISKPHTDNLETTIVQVRQLLEDTVQRQIVADVPVCTLLSGGLDSSALSAFAAQAYAKNGWGALNTYSIDYVDNNIHFKPSLFQPNEDAPWIERVSQHFGTIHHHVLVDTPELVEYLTPAMEARDLPGMADIDSSLYLFCRRIKKDATVAVSGECADEIFGGYPWFHKPEALSANTFPWLRMISERARILSPEAREYIRPEEYVNDRYQQAINEVPRLSGESKQEARMREMFYLNITRFMATLLDRKDRMSMAVGLEVRVPFCDHRLLEYVWNVPWEMKYCEKREKGLLRRALVGVLPEDVLWRQKSPYPKTHNPAYLAATQKGILNILSDSTSPLLPLIDVDTVQEIALTGANTNIPYFGQLMSTPQLFAYLMQTDAWLRKYKVVIK
jgi:asparagine synthase (glutamine-hydrolysing)